MLGKASKWFQDPKADREAAKEKEAALRKEADAYYDALDKAKRYFGESKSRVSVLTGKDYDTYVRSIGGEAPGWTQRVKDFYAEKPVVVKYSDLDFFNDLLNNVDSDNFEM